MGNMDYEDDEDLDDEYVDETDYARLEELKDEISSRISEFVRVSREESVQDGDHPIVRAWVIAYEWTNIELEQNNAGAREYIAPAEQTISSSAGLGLFLVNQLG